MKKYLIIKDKTAKLNPINCYYLGLPKESNFQDLVNVITEPEFVHEQIRQKEGKDITIIPFNFKDEYVFNPKKEVYEVLTKEQMLNYGWDIIDEL